MKIYSFGKSRLGFKMWRGHEYARIPWKDGAEALFQDFNDDHIDSIEIFLKGVFEGYTIKKIGLGNFTYEVFVNFVNKEDEAHFHMLSNSGIDVPV